MPAALSHGSMPTPQTLRFGVWKTASDDTHASSSPPQWQAEWLLKRNCSMAPRQLLSAYLALCLFSLAIALLLWSIGASYVLPFACLEVVVLGAAMLAYARHAADRDVIALRADLVRVERHTAGRLEAVDFNPRWVRVEPQRHDGSLIRVSGQGRTMDVGRFVPPGLRRQLAEEVRGALRQLERRQSFQH